MKLEIEHAGVRHLAFMKLTSAGRVRSTDLNIIGESSSCKIGVINLILFVGRALDVCGRNKLFCRCFFEGI